LLAIAIPAVQRARESARRNACLGQAGFLAVGCLNHHEIHGHFPSGGWGRAFVGDPDRGFGPDQPGSWLYNVLPFVENQELHDLGSDGDALLITTEQRTGARKVLTSPPAFINCPTRRQSMVLTNNGIIHNADASPSVAGRSDYAINSGTYYVEYSDGPECAMDYAPAASYSDWLADSVDMINNPWKLNGVSHQRSTVTSNEVLDGLSNTLLLGEKMLLPTDYQTGTSAGDDDTWCSGFNNDNHRMVEVRSVGSAREPQFEYDQPVADTAPNIDDRFERFGSAHETTWNASFCDGSARSLSYDIDGQVGARLADRRDANRVDASEL
jgi:hypothetical protein